MGIVRHLFRLSFVRFAAALLLRTCFLALALAFFAGTSAWAHPSPTTAVLMDINPNGVATDLVLPIQELELGFGKPLVPIPDKVITTYGPQLKSYVLAHIDPETPDHQPWTVQVTGMEMKLNERPIDLVVHLWMVPPAGAPVRKFTLNYSVISHQVISHSSLVFIRNDWNTSVFSSQPEFIGMIHFLTKSVEVDRTKGGWWRGCESVLKLGIQHIAEGTDHLLFLLVLLLPAPLKAVGNHWGGYVGLKRSLLQLLKIVTAFTVGHSITLAIGTLGWVRLPAQPVEILIAVSIVISAAHALRPIFPGREPWIAAGFGLVHGLSFATSLSEFGFSPIYLALTILSFNTGIELMQLIVVLATIPWLILLSRTRYYTPVRIAGAAFGGVAALAWIGQRAFLWPNPFDAVVNDLAHHSLWVVGVLAALALAATIAQATAPSCHSPSALNTP